MAQSLVNNYIHIVFSTKYRQKLIYSPFEEELHSYMGGICNELECQPIKIGGYSDHVHVLCNLSKKIPLMKLLEVVKNNSSKWMKTKHESLVNFYWQNGYAAFSVNPSDLERVIKYIENQKVHHGLKDFQDELRAMLKKYNIDFDERYIWD